MSYRRYRISYIIHILDLYFLGVFAHDQLRAAVSDNESKGDLILPSGQDGLSNVQLLCDEAWGEHLITHTQPTVQAAAMQGGGCDGIRRRRARAVRKVEKPVSRFAFFGRWSTILSPKD